MLEFMQAVTGRHNLLVLQAVQVSFCSPVAVEFGDFEILHWQLDYIFTLRFQSEDYRRNDFTQAVHGKNRAHNYSKRNNLFPMMLLIPVES